MVRWTRLPGLGLALAGGLLSAQAVVGRLVYATPAGRGLTLTVVAAGHPAMVTLRPETGDAQALRQFILGHSGPEALVAKGAQRLAERAPVGWRGAPGADPVLVRDGAATYWRYTPGLVLPVRFGFGRQTWTLISAELPGRMLVAAAE